MRQERDQRREEEDVDRDDRAQEQDEAAHPGDATKRLPAHLVTDGTRND
jgi:hypothetical protein